MAEPAARSGAARVRVIVVNHNGGDWLRRCLDALCAQTLRDFEAVVIDNASGDGSMPASHPDPRIRLLPQHENLGFAVANNLGAQDARTPWLALLNPDAIAAPDWLERLLEDAQRHPECAVFGSTQLRADAPAVLDGTGDCLSAYGLSWRSGYGLPVPAQLPDGEVMAACGAALMIRRDLFERLGGFEPGFFCYVEDVDLCFRARLRGARIWQSARAQVAHAGGASSGQGESPFAIFHGYRNMIWLQLRCMPLPWLLLALPGLIAFALLRITRLRTPQRRAAMWRGIGAGLRGWRTAWTQRAHIQAQRRVGVWTVGRWLSWNPRDTLRRRCILLASR